MASGAMEKVPSLRRQLGLFYSFVEEGYDSVNPFHLPHVSLKHHHARSTDIRLIHMEHN